jgi:hypothetical protein
MLVNGSVTPVDFKIFAIADYDIFIQELRFYATASSIKFGQFLSLNIPLANGIEVQIKSDDAYLTLPNIKTTEDLKNKFAVGGQWSLEAQPSLTSLLATFHLDAPIPIRHIGEYAIDDYIRIRVRDNLVAAASVLECLAFGFKRAI